MVMKVFACIGVFLPLVASHSNLIRPKPRNAIDSELPEWSNGNAPYMWVPGIGNNGTPCACKNGTDVCAPAQTCLWMSVGCSIGCKECDGGDQGTTNPNRKDRCGSGMKSTNNDPKHRTVNRAAQAGSDADWTKFNPWRAPGHAPVYDPCGRASGSYKATAGKGEFTDTKYAKLGDLGSQVLPVYDTGTVWEAGSTVETMTSFRANHGGGKTMSMPASPITYLTSAYFVCLSPLFDAMMIRLSIPTLPAGIELDGGLLPAEADAVRKQLKADDFGRQHYRTQFGGRLERNVACWGFVADVGSS